MRTAPPPKALQKRLLAWYRASRRDLPWRRTRDPYRIWVSEVMLQQTQVATVIPYYRRFLETFPDVRALARAPEPKVLAAWAGLGYYSRARNLHAAAKAIAARGFPRTAEGLRGLPGVGRYTAGAVASIAFGLSEPLVDGNVVRVLSRLYGLRGDLSNASGQERVWSLAASLVERSAPGDWNQALMELGATVCSPAVPRCGACPVAGLCAARAEGAPERYPDLGPAKRSVAVRLACVVAAKDGRVLLERRGRESRFLPGHWGLPAVEAAGGARAALEAAFPGVAVGEPAGSVRHSITHHRIRMDLFRADAARVRAPLAWVPREKADSLLVSSLFRKAIQISRTDPRSC